MGEGDRLERMEKMLYDLLVRLERLEAILREAFPDPLVTAALELAMTYSQPATKAVKVAKAVLDVERRLRSKDPISRAIIEALAIREKPLSLSELTEEVRELRGTASRRIVRERVQALERAGIVKARRVGKKVLVDLVMKGEDEDH
ncbi:MAG: winged helix-turn-helix transcriptional regulator [Desulfurococcales archaeon]|nr:winged helix-turn-helix transcriptional regulator [Desulfurococcales archaeon]